MNVKQVLNTEDPYGDKFAKALMALIKNTEYGLGLRFNEFSREDVQQNVLLKLYEKTIPKLDGKNNFAFLRTKVRQLLIDEVRKLGKHIDREERMDEALEAVLKTEEGVDYDSLIAVCEGVLESEKEPLYLKRARRLLEEMKQRKLSS